MFRQEDGVLLRGWCWRCCRCVIKVLQLGGNGASSVPQRGEGGQQYSFERQVLQGKKDTTVRKIGLNTAEDLQVWMCCRVELRPKYGTYVLDRHPKRVNEI